LKPDCEYVLQRKAMTVAPLLTSSRSLQSGLSSNYREKWACFAYFGGKSGEIALQLRLAGGESGILDARRYRPCPFNEMPTTEVTTDS